MVAKFNSKTHLQNTFFRFFEPVTSKFAIMCFYDYQIFSKKQYGYQETQNVDAYYESVEKLAKNRAKFIAL
jgi:hypothetical protein